MPGAPALAQSILAPAVEAGDGRTYLRVGRAVYPPCTEAHPYARGS